MPKAIDTKGFSGGIQLGFLRDIPLNTKGNLAIAIGLGYAINSFGQTIRIERDSNNNVTFNAFDENENPKTNRFSTYEIELPIEFRWRTSSAKVYKFWRIYPGFKFGYIHSFRSIYEDNNNKIKVRNPSALNNFRTGLSLSIGYNTFNFYSYYSLNPLFNKKALIDNEPLDFRHLKLGIRFYIL